MVLKREKRQEETTENQIVQTGVCCKRVYEVVGDLVLETSLLVMKKQETRKSFPLWRTFESLIGGGCMRDAALAGDRECLVSIFS